MHASNDDCIHRAFQRRVQETPSATALVYLEQTITYAELDRHSDLLAASMATLVAPGDVVALYMDRSPAMIATMLAVLKCGAAYMPVDTGNPETRNLAFLQKAEVPLIISDRSCDPLLVGGRRNLRVDQLELSTGLAGTGPGTTQFAGPSLTSDAVAYVMFTSGTTSDPKGVVIPHRAVTRLVLETNYIRIHPDDVLLHASTPSFDASTFEIWGALLNGATLVLYSGAVLDPKLFKRHVVEHGVTILWLTAALFHLFVDHYLDSLRTVKTLLAGGDVLHPRAVRTLLENVEGIVLINGYGPTENTTFTCCHVMSAANIPETVVPIGTAITGTRVHVLDEHGQEVASGETGELYASGLGVALGYLGGRPGEDPFLLDSRIAEGLVYRTGDLVRRNPLGLLEFVGRTDCQVKIRGYRVSLEEVKAHLVDIPSVREAVVTTQEVDGSDQLLVAWLLVEQGHTLDSDEVRKHLADRVPPYMIPNRISISTDIPITPNGKVDRNRILTPIN